MPDNNNNDVIEQKPRKYKDTNIILPYTDPYTKKDFYVVEGTNKNINNPDVFMVDVSSSGHPIYATYTKPGGKDITDYVRQTRREFTDEEGGHKLFPISENLDKLIQGQNPWKDRKYLQDWNPGKIYNVENLNKTVAEQQNLYKGNPQQIASNINKARVDRFVKENPQYQSFFEAHPIPQTSGDNTRQLDKVVASYDGNDRIDTDEGVVFKEPGWNFYKVYNDKSKEQIDKNSYQTMKVFNNLPQNIKNLYSEILPQEQVATTNEQE